MFQQKGIITWGIIGTLDRLTRREWLETLLAGKITTIWGFIDQISTKLE